MRARSLRCKHSVKPAMLNGIPHKFPSFVMQVQRSHVFTTKLLAVSNLPSLLQTIPIAPPTFLYVVTVCWAFHIHISVLDKASRCLCITCSVSLMWVHSTVCMHRHNSQWDCSHTTFSPPPLLVNSSASYLPMPSTVNITVGQYHDHPLRLTVVNSCYAWSPHETTSMLCVNEKIIPQCTTFHETLSLCKIWSMWVLRLLSFASSTGLRRRTMWCE